MYGRSSRPIGIVVVPRGSRGALGAPALFGHVGVFFLPNASATNEPFHARIAALNEKGLSCDEQHLNGSQYPAPTGDPTRDLSILRFCEWAAASFENVSEVKAHLPAAAIAALDAEARLAALANVDADAL